MYQKLSIYELRTIIKWFDITMCHDSHLVRLSSSSPGQGRPSSRPLWTRPSLPSLSGMDLFRGTKDRSLSFDTYVRLFRHSEITTFMCQS